MKTIEARVSVDEDRKVTIQLPASMPTGEYEIVLVLNDCSAQDARQSSIQAAQDLLRKYVPAGRSLSDELIQERRAEGLNE
ncbi:hypothetical protein NIES2104_66690 [Leptolyngbya sp. NIES-2104]|nr:hypothetical protein NIES2104_66690 [Leptolyngbya sp. NIES-2104]